MPEYKAPLRDMRFLIDEVFDFHGRYQALGASDATPDMVAAILDEGSKFCEQVLAPIISLSSRPSECGRPWPPYAGSLATPFQPPSTYCA